MDIFKITLKVILLFGLITIAFTGTVQQIYIKDNNVPLKGGVIRIVCEVSQFIKDEVVSVYKTDTVPLLLYYDPDVPVALCSPTGCIHALLNHTFSSSSSGVTIKVTNLNRSEDQKYWTCAINSQKKYMQLTVYTITPSLQYDNPPSQDQDLVRTSVTYSCSTGCAYPSPNFTWYYNKTNESRQEWSTTAPVTDSTNGCTDSEKIYTSTLTLPRYTQFTDNTDTSVKFQCGAISVTGATDQRFTPASVNVKFAVRVSTVTLKDGNSVSSNPLEVNTGEPHTLTCTSSVSRPTATIIWYFGGQKNKTETTRTSTFTFTPEYSDNQNQVYCKAFNIQSESQAVSSNIVSLYVKVKVANVTLKDGNTETSGTLEVTNGVTKTLTCAASESRPIATIIWYIGDDKKKSESVLLSSFTFIPVISDHNKQVYCKASQSGNPDVFSNRIAFYVKGKPMVCDCNNGAVNNDIKSLIVGIVLGIIIVIVVAYAGYVTILLKRRNGSTAENTIIQPAQRTVPLNTSVVFSTNDSEEQQGTDPDESGESQYTSLKNELKDDRQTYDQLKV